MNESSSSVLDQIMTELTPPHAGILPEDALKLAREHRQQMIPRLIEAIELATERARNGEIVEERAHFFAFFLLTEFEASEALPAIVESVLLPGETPHELYGDTITEKLQGTLAALSKPPYEEIERIIRCDEADEYVRWAAVGSYLFLVRDGKMTREEAVRRLKRHLVNEIELATEIEEDFFPLVTYLICELCKYSPHEAEAEIRQAFEAGLVDELVVKRQSIEKSLRGGDDYHQKSLEYCGPTGVHDTVKELSRWHCFNPAPPASDAEYLDEDDWNDDEDWVIPDDSDTIRNQSPKIGRNEPCPCGSGKKHKKCCGKK